MYLKQLDVLGFKSFPNKTSIKFSPGKTAIVGPNGCGKTNILDAIRWVMGEQKTSLLRGSKMEEIIFNGSRDLSALGMAEVTLTMINNRGVLPVEYSEVQITRRLFRSGEAEYLLNKVPCRLKDITELFYDTGAGAHSYSVIQQEMIDSVISDKAEERRFLFEEAAGITKYKQRKKAALRKLEATQQDFLRLRDIYSEVKTQVNSLKRQHRKAERYQRLSNEVRDWELYLTSQRVKTLELEKRSLKEGFDKLSGNILESETQIDTFGADVEAARRQQLDIEHELSRVGNELFEISDSAHNLEKEISVLNEKRTNAQTLIERNKKEIEALNGRSSTLSEQGVDTGAELNKLRAKHKELQNQLDEAQAAQALADKNLLTARNAKDANSSKLIEIESKISSGKTEEGNLKSQVNELQDTLVRLNRQNDEVTTTKEKLGQTLTVHKERVAEQIAKRSEKQQEHQQTIDLTAELRQNLDSNTKNQTNRTASLEACEAQVNLLKELIYSFEGPESGLKSILELREQWPGILGTIADKFTPTKGMQRAVEAALGEISRYVICESRETAEKIVDHLKSERKGRAGLIVPDTGTINPLVKRPEMTMPGFIGWLDSYVDTDDELKPLMQAVLSQTAVFEAGSDPGAILERLPHGFRAVSTDGLLYSKFSIVGGSLEALQLFSRKEQIAEIEAQIVDLKSSLGKLREDEASLNQELTDAERSHQALANELQQLDDTIASDQKSIDETTYEFRLAESEHTRIKKELETSNEKLTLLQQKQYSLGLDYGQLDEQKQNLMSSFDETKRKLQDYEQAATTAISTVSKLQVSVVEAQSEINQCESRINHARELLDEIARTVETKESEITDAESEIESSIKRIEDFETKLKLSFEARSDITDAQTELKKKHTEMLEETGKIERQLKELRNSKEKVNRESHQAEMRLNSFESEVKSIIERIRDEYDVSIKEVEADNPDPELSEFEAREHLVNQKEALKKFGAVNLLALEEYDSASERKEFLGKQLEDLEAAVEDLTATITKINKTAREMFEDIFVKVQENFQNLFVELFEGGEAGLFLQNPNDPLESDIEITARPRGKKLLSITMMSGGERALTAISLLFSLYLVKPSAYCILDEIDAPLDDSNCRRFLKLISRFSHSTQFIIITHNKITMETADNLYGVTMAQPGVSQIVAVKFSEIDSEGGEIVLATPEEDTPERELDTDTVAVPDKVVERISSNVSTSVKSSDND